MNLSFFGFPAQWIGYYRGGRFSFDEHQ